jgi:hypothetical protein
MGLILGPNAASFFIFAISQFAIIQVDVLWVVTPCNIMEGHQGFRGPFCLHLQAEDTCFIHIQSEDGGNIVL